MTEEEIRADERGKIQATWDIVLRDVEKRNWNAALDAAEAALLNVGATITFDMRNIPAYAERSFAAIRALKVRPC